MAQKLLRAVGKRKVAAKKSVSAEEKRNVLVGTYGPNQLEKWPGYYNYPLYGKDKIDVEAVKKVNELWLFSGAKLPRYFVAECLGVKTREELKEFGYKATGKGHGSGQYLLFKIKKLYAPSRDFAESVTIRTKDFAGQGATQKQLKDYLESPDRKDPLLAKMLPKIVTELPRERLRVCEAAVQLDFYCSMFAPIENAALRDEKNVISMFSGAMGLDNMITEARSRGWSFESGVLTSPDMKYFAVVSQDPCSAKNFAIGIVVGNSKAKVYLLHENDQMVRKRPRIPQSFKDRIVVQSYGDFCSTAFSDGMINRRLKAGHYE